jgi:hypothetical protein
MKVPPRDRGKKASQQAPLSGDQLIRDYLTRVAQAGLWLPKGVRMAFIGRTKARIERALEPGGTSDPGKVLAVLEELGEPEDLVRAERAKIDAAWVKRRAGGREAGEQAAAAVTAPRQPRRLNSRWRPATDTQPLPHVTSSRPTPIVTPSGQPAAPQQPETEPPTDPGGSIVPITAAGRPSGPDLTLATAGQLARGHKLETVAIVMLGLGGVLFPIMPPAWVLGSLLAVLSRIWDLKDKALALFGPVLVTSLVAAMSAVVNRVPGNFVVIYFHAFGDGAGYLLRFGCVLTAVYLAWRVYRGPREKIPPWRRTPPPRRVR